MAEEEEQELENNLEERNVQEPFVTDAVVTWRDVSPIAETSGRKSNGQNAVPPVVEECEQVSGSESVDPKSQEREDTDDHATHDAKVLTT